MTEDLDGRLVGRETRTIARICGMDDAEAESILTASRNMQRSPHSNLWGFTGGRDASPRSITIHHDGRVEFPQDKIMPAKAAKRAPKAKAVKAAPAPVIAPALSPEQLFGDDLLG
jgi:hypothetical protein